MESQNGSSIHSHDYGRNKVYVNRNFNKVQPKSSGNNSILHVNPKFSYLVSNGHGNIHSKNKIYVNPNFIKLSSASEINPLASTVNNTVFEHNAISNSISITDHMQHNPIENNEKTVLQVPITQSRYCLVRKTVTNKVVERPMPDKAKNTFKINKYKSVPWNYVKRSLDDAKNIPINNVNFLPHTNKNVDKSVVQKYTCLLASPKNKEFSLVPEKLRTTVYKYTNKKISKTMVLSQSLVKKSKGNFKKNNTPCPLYRKFGICIRSLRDKCEFLHDKKHVSICRKFIKGLCHDKNCLLSHDLTTEKMPTCYFYLQGTCNKTDCPYLHVKLNENTKVCPEFVKGYCEKGSKCLQRHINVQTEKRNKSSSSLINKSLSKRKDLKMSKHYMISRERDDRKVGKATADKKDEKSLVNAGTSEHRYYEEHKIEENARVCESIKPMRCKLGVLPSFIEL